MILVKPACAGFFYVVFCYYIDAMRSIYKKRNFKQFVFTLVGLVLLSLPAAAQAPVLMLADILKAEDARDFGPQLIVYLKSPNDDLRLRATLAAGRIGDEAAVSILAEILAKDESDKVRAMAAFAIGEIESVKGADTILKALDDRTIAPEIRARAVEAAGKIAAANAKDESAKRLGQAVVDTLEFENRKRGAADQDIVRAGLTAVLRARPEGGDVATAVFLTYSDAAVRADAANTMARLRAKNANATLKEMVLFDKDDAVRANAIRALVAGEDKGSVNLLIETATNDKNVSIRIAGQRALATLGDKTAAEPLLAHANKTLENFKKAKKPNFIPVEKNELLELATALSRLYADTSDAKALQFIEAWRIADNFNSTETEAAFARIAPAKYIADFSKLNKGYTDFNIPTAYAAGFAHIATLKDEDLKAKAGQAFTAYIASFQSGVAKKDEAKMNLALPAMAQTLAALKPDNLNDILLSLLNSDNVFLRATVAELLSEQPLSNENIAALKKAFTMSLLKDKTYNDATLAIMDALFKLDKNESVGSLLSALNAPDYLVRNKAFELLAQADTEKFPGVPTMIEAAREKNGHKVLPYQSYTGTRLGQVLNVDADYRRAARRKNGSVKAVFTTQKGTFTIDLLPEDAPLTVDNFIKLANARYFNGLAVHRVVPNFVMQDGDPLGNGSGGPAWSIRCEVNMVPYDRGAVGMALSGKDTGGSQWFVTHLAQPHLDGGYTVFGKVNETDMNVVDKIVRGDKILTVRIVEGATAPRARTK